MRIESEKHTTRIVVCCGDEERSSAEDWLADRGYVSVSEWQFQSNQFRIEAERSTQIFFYEGTRAGKNAIEVAREAVKQTKLGHRVRGCEDPLPELEETDFTDYPFSVAFDTDEFGTVIRVFLKKRGENFVASGWSIET